MERILDLFLVPVIILVAAILIGWGVISENKGDSKNHNQACSQLRNQGFHISCSDLSIFEGGWINIIKGTCNYTYGLKKINNIFRVTKTIPGENGYKILTPQTATEDC